MPDDPPTVPQYQAPLKLTPEQIEFIKPLLAMERPAGAQPNMIFAQVRSAPWPHHGDVEIAFVMVDYGTAGKILHTIESSKKTRYAPVGSRANFVELLPQGEVVFVSKDKRNKQTNENKPEKETQKAEARTPARPKFKKVL